MPHIRLDTVKDISGFTLANVERDHYFWLLQRESLTSDQPEFQRYIEQLQNAFLHKAGVPPDSVTQFLAVTHEDMSADLYINDFAVVLEMIAKRDIQKAEPVAQIDLADIRRLRFPEATITSTDRVVYCFKANWKFGLFFDLTRELDVDAMELSLGSLYRHITFQHIYESLASEPKYEELKRDGWFPFIEIAGHEYKVILRCYENRFGFESRIDEVVRAFDRQRLERITGKWWRKQVFEEKKDILMAGVNGFLRGDKDGIISCINTLLPQVEGIMSKSYLADTGSGRGVKLQSLFTYILEKGRTKTGSDLSLFLPAKFFEFLRDVTFAHYDPESSQIDLSRHSSSHGVAPAEAYTPTRALQAILIVDQLYFYL